MLATGFLQGAKIRLTPVNDNDFNVIAAWFRDMDFKRLIMHHIAYPLSEEQIITQWQSMRDSSDVYMFGIRPIGSDDFLGWVKLDNIVWHNGVANISIGIGYTGNQGKGYGTEAIQLALQFAFHELNLHRVQLIVFSYNEPAIAVYEKVGFKREGVQREFLQRDGQRHDAYIYGLLRSEWDKVRD